MRVSKLGMKGKKKVKDIHIQIDPQIPKQMDRCMNFFIPKREVLQRLVTRVANMKGEFMPPECEDVTPWVRPDFRLNRDLG